MGLWWFGEYFFVEVLPFELSLLGLFSRLVISYVGLLIVLFGTFFLIREIWQLNRRILLNRL